MTRHSRDAVVLEDVRLIFKNFSGVGKRFNDEGKRNFLVLLDEETGARLIADGYKVKRLKPREDYDQGDLALKVTVNFKGLRPPKLVLITKSTNGRTPLDEDLAHLFDVCDFEQVDIRFSPYDRRGDDGEWSRTAYLQTAYGVLREDPLDLKYSEYDNQPRALEAGEDPDVVDAEVLDEYDDEEQLALPRGSR